jgi:hypothetical protein
LRFTGTAFGLIGRRPSDFGVRRFYLSVGGSGSRGPDAYVNRQYQ